MEYKSIKPQCVKLSLNENEYKQSQLSSCQRKSYEFVVKDSVKDNKSSKQSMSSRIGSRDVVGAKRLHLDENTSREFGSFTNESKREKHINIKLPQVKPNQDNNVYSKHHVTKKNSIETQEDESTERQPLNTDNMPTP